MKKMISLMICLAMVMVMTVAAVPFAVLAADGDSGSIAVVTPYAGTNPKENYINSYTFTAPKDGDYAFSVPAGLGVWERTGYWMDDPSTHYVDYTTNTTGATFTLTMTAGQSFTFYVGTNSPDVTAGTITWAILAPPDPNAGSIEVTANYDGPILAANYTTQYTFTPQMDGVYTFSVPAGLGVWERVGYWMQDPTTHYVDCATNTDGKTFTLTLKAGENFLFYVGTSSPDVTSGTITWTRAEIELPSADQLAADAVIAKINEIGFVELTSKEVIEATRAAYDALTDAQKALVTNYDVLTTAEAALKELEEQIANAPNSGSIPVEAEYRGAGQHENYKKNHTFTAQKDGEYTFFVPAGLGVWEFWGYWDYVDGISPNNKLYVDYATNTEGKTFTLTLKAGENFKFYVGTNSPDLTSGTITWAIAGTDLPEQPNNDQVAADAVNAQIEAIGTVTLETEAAITAARTAYNALTDAQKALVTKLEILTAAEAALADLKQAATDKAAADAVIAKIEAIGTVALTSKDTIEAARTAYTALTDVQKLLVTNLETLEAAEAQLKVLQDQAAENEADKAAADAVIAKINEIGEVTLDSETAIAAARTAYNALTDTQKALVTNNAALTAAETRLQELKDQAAQAAADQKAADAVAAKIEAIGTVTKESKKVIEAARTAYNALTDAQKALVTNLDKLAAAERTLADLNKPVNPDPSLPSTGDYTVAFFAMLVLSMTGLVVVGSRKRAH